MVDADWTLESYIGPFSRVYVTISWDDGVVSYDGGHYSPWISKAEGSVQRRDIDSGTIIHANFSANYLIEEELEGWTLEPMFNICFVL